MNYEYFSFHAEIKFETRAAFLVDDGINEDLWIPKSQIDDDFSLWKIGDLVEITIPEWIAIEKGIA